MQRTLVFSLLVVGAGVVLIIGAYSALAGDGPVSSVAGAVSSAEGPAGGDAAQDADGDDGEDVDGEDGGGEAKGARHIAGLIEDAFGAEEGSAWTLHEEGIGFGAQFKLYALAAAMDMSVDDLLATIPTDGDGGHEFGFGKLRKALTEDQLAALESSPKNLGRLVSASHRPEHAGPDAGEAGGGHGPPDHAPAHGRR
jgi:hypothetical protein